MSSHYKYDKRRNKRRQHITRNLSRSHYGIPNVDILDPDTEFLAYSYLPLEDILALFKDDIPMRDRLIRLNYPIPTLDFIDIDKEAGAGNLETVKYLYSKGVTPTEKGADLAAEHGYLDIVKFLMSEQIYPTFYGRHKARKNGHKEVEKYIYKTLESEQLKQEKSEKLKREKEYTVWSNLSNIYGHLSRMAQDDDLIYANLSHMADDDY